MAAPTIPYFGIIRIFNKIFKKAIKKDSSAICLSLPRILSRVLEAVIMERNIKLGLNIINIFAESLYKDPNTRWNPMGTNINELKNSSKADRSIVL